MKTIRQRVRYLTASDGTRLAWADAGEGPLVVKAANWLTHLEYEWESPVWKHWIQFFSSNFRFVRHDERGCGMSEWHDGGLSIDQWADDLARVIDAARPDGPVTLLGISQGAATCIRYATRHPERVARMIFYGGYARGAMRRDNRRGGSGPQGDDRAGPCRLGQVEPDLPPGVHVAVHSRAARPSSCSGSMTCASRRRPARCSHGC